MLFFGHRNVYESEDLKAILKQEIERLIKYRNVNTFLFGSKSKFDDLCYEIVSKLKMEFPYIKRVYVRAEYEIITIKYENYILKGYEEIYFPGSIKNSGRASYVERNREMIDCSNYCIVYYEKSYLPPKRKLRKNEIIEYQPRSGTAIAYDYAVKKRKTIINIAEY